MKGPTLSARPVVLLVEDEPFVRMATADALEEAGYDVIETAHAQAAHEILQSRSDIRVLFTDVKMPGPMNGLELASLVRGRWPHISIVITSGHLDPRRDVLPEETVFIPKPYGEQAPARAIRALLA